MNEERIKAIFSDESFVKQLLEQETAEQVQALLAEKEIDISVDEIIKVHEILIKHVNGEVNLEELSDEELSDISGGGLLTCGILAICAIAAGTAVMATGGVAYAVDSSMRSRGRRW